MMKRIFIELINLCIDNPKTITYLQIENPIIYRTFIYSIKEKLIYSENNIVLDNDKRMLIITNPCEINMNDKKMLSNLYKYLMNNITDSIKEKINNINVDIINVIDDIIMENDYPINYEMEIEFHKILNLFQVSFKDIKQDNYLENLLIYIKFHKEISKTKIIVTFGLKNMLSEEELKSLEKELIIIDVILLDITIVSSTKITNIYTIDSDWCII